MVESDLIHCVGILPGMLAAAGVLLKRREITKVGILTSSALISAHLLFSPSESILTISVTSDLIGMGLAMFATVFRKPIGW